MSEYNPEPHENTDGTQPTGGTDQQVTAGGEWWELYRRQGVTYHLLELPGDGQSLARTLEDALSGLNDKKRYFSRVHETDPQSAEMLARTQSRTDGADG